MDKNLFDKLCEKCPGFKEAHKEDLELTKKFNGGEIANQEYSEGILKIQEKFNNQFNNLI